MIVFEKTDGLIAYTIAGKKNVFVGLTNSDSKAIEEKKISYGSYLEIPNEYEVSAFGMALNIETGKYVFDKNSFIRRPMNELDAGLLQIE